MLVPVLAALLLGEALASPVLEERQAAASFCKVVTQVVTVLKAQNTATAFCSSYLKISTSTSTLRSTSVSAVTETVTTGTATVTLPVKVNTVEETSTPAATTITVTSTETATSFTGISTVTVSSTVLNLCDQQENNQKRAAPTVAKPAVFKSYTAAAVISSACKCLSIPTPISTVNQATIVSSTVATVTVPATTLTLTPPVSLTTLTISGTVRTETSTAKVTSTVSTISTTTIYQTSTVAERPAWSTFKAQASVNQNYLTVGSPLNAGYGYFGASTFSEGHLFAIEPSTCHLVDITGGTQKVARTLRMFASSRVYFFNDSDKDVGFQLPLSCSVDANTRVLSCDNPGRGYDVDSLDCIGSWWVGYANFNSCEVGKFAITVVPAL